ncbi:hypothetical protein WQ57_06945 [Mesobacillus campisalis]|uniref:O-antigen ligase-related domain-containing protein n=1 Tax=Mesobacillus campisalis TaxID=1408103 RepID=A0A0M2T1M2_9BACI|nr:O-antigen ligase family protein [Mesobacillus campisalis]KKK38720.1 hypothetical protein WQ57_06945 [Mesobacillus campisalis]
MNYLEVHLKEKVQYKKLIKGSLYLIIAFLFLTPSFKIVEFIPKIRLEEVFTFLIVLFLIMRVILKKYVLLAFNSTILLLISFCFFIGFSVLNGTFQGYQTSIFDFNQFVMVFKYAVIYTVALTFYYLNSEDKNEMKKVLRFIFFMSTLLFFIVLQQYFNLFGLNEKYIRLVAPTQYDTLVNNYAHPRPVGMLGNPNELGFLFVMVALLVLFILLNHEFKVTLLLVFMMQISGVFLTLSRTSLVALVIGTTVVIVPAMLSRKNSLKKHARFLVFFFVLISAIFYAVTYTDFIDKIWWRFTEIFNLSHSTSWNARLTNWSENMDIFLQHFVIGVGPLSRAIFQHAADNEWLLLLRSYGIIGTLVVCFIFTYLAINSKISNRALLLSIVMAGGVYMVSSVFFQSLVLMPVFLILAAISNSVTKVVVVTR